jgi:hypothetical protein
MRTCSKCNKDFPPTVEFFYKSKVNGSGEQLLKGRCKLCCRQNKEQRTKDAKNYYERHKETILKKNMVKYIQNRHGIVLAC